MASQLPRVSDQVWNLLERMRVALGRVARGDSGPAPDRTLMQRPVYDESRGGVLVSTPGLPRTPVYGAEEYQALQDLVAPSPGRRLGRLFRGRTTRDTAILHTTLIASLKAVARFAESSQPQRDGQPAGVAQTSGLAQSVAAALTAVTFDRVLNELEEGRHVPRGTAADLRLGWDGMGADDRQRFLADLDPVALSGYTFAEAVGRRTEMEPEAILYRLNSAPDGTAQHVAARLLLEGSGHDPATYPEVADHIAVSIRVDFDQLRDVGATGAGPRYRVDPVENAALPGRWAAERAIELVDHLEKNLGEAAPESRGAEIRDPRTGLAGPSSTPTIAAVQNDGQAVTRTTTTQARDGIDGGR